MKLFQIINTLLFLFLFVESAFCVVIAKLPEGWREPVQSEVNHDWRKRDDSKYLSVEGDFNGDGNKDIAKILVREDGRGIGLFAFVADPEGDFKFHSLDVIEESSPKIHLIMGILKVSPGKYNTACGKGYWNCEKDEVPEIDIEYDAISHFYYESAASYFYWSDPENKFRQIQISD